MAKELLITSIRIAFTDFPGPFNPDRILALLKQNYTVTVDQENPDYVIYSVFGYDYMQYDKAVRIFFTGENVIPDFNLCDYAFGYSWIEFGDRYYRCPNYQLYDQYKDLLNRKSSVQADNILEYEKPKFCNFIYTNGDGHPIRDEFFHHLSAIKSVDSVGKHLRNVQDTIGTPYHGDWTKPKIDFQKRYRFTIAFENSTSPGYTTEKLIHALSADTIPIYWGNPLVGREFNTKRFINCHDFNSLEEVANQVMQLENNPALLESMLREPFFPDNKPTIGLNDEDILAQFNLIFEQEHSLAFRRNFHYFGEIYEKQRAQEVNTFKFVNSENLRGKIVRGIRTLSSQF
ncbi:glycosyltransferase family 10 domain-containing protein [Agarivorans sp. MS3-6]